MLSKEQIKEGNKIIIAYVGNEIKKPNGVVEGLLHHNHIYFHSSMDWLLPVIEKIEKTHEVAIIDNECEIGTTGYRYTTVAFAKAETKLEAVWLAVVEFIKKYNNKEV